LRKQLGLSPDYLRTRRSLWEQSRIKQGKVPLTRSKMRTQTGTAICCTLSSNRQLSRILASSIGTKPVNSVPNCYQALRSFSFGDGAELADELLDLVLKGIKTATCSPDQRHAFSWHNGAHCDDGNAHRCANQRISTSTTAVTIGGCDRVGQRS
jgi:hypothetical protein